MLLSSVGWRALKATLTGMLSPLPREHVVETCTRLPRGGKARHRALRNMPSTNLSDPTLPLHSALTRLFLQHLFGVLLCQLPESRLGPIHAALRAVFY